MSAEQPIAIEATIHGVLKQYTDGSWKVAILVDPHQAQMYLTHMSEIGTRIAIAKLGKPDTPPAAADAEVKAAVAERRPAKEKGKYGKYARALRLHIDWMGNPKVWDSFGGDEDFLKWVREQPCCEMSMDCGGDVVAAHVRRIANGAGVGIKPPYSAVPLCDHHHRIQHQHGENAFARGGHDGKSWFDRLRIEHVHEWLWQAMRDHLGVSSMTEVSPWDMLLHAEALGIAQFLPQVYHDDAEPPDPT